MDFSFDPEITKEVLLEYNNEETYMAHYLNMPIKKGLFFYIFLNMGKKLTTESVIALLEEKYPNKFDYSKFQYTKAADKVTLICKDCGLEFQTTYNILRKGKHGCPNCYRQSTKRSKEDLLNIIEKYYPNKYDYSKVNYINTRTPIVLICKQCKKEFSLKPQDIIRNYIKELCPNCRKEQEIQNNYKQFLHRLEASSLHIIPSNNNFRTYKQPMEFTCTKCGHHFKSTPDHILNSYIGCPICAEQSRRKARTHTTEQFIKDAQKVHGNFYNYDKTFYLGCHKKLTVTCPKHGDFVVCAGDHLQGSGCPKCSQTKGEQLVQTYLDKYKIDYQIQFIIKDSIFHRKFVRVDFYIKSLNTIIEFNGIQHYKPIDYFGGEQRFKEQIERDNDLRQYCKVNNINLIEINYLKSKDEIEEIIKTL